MSGAYKWAAAGLRAEALNQIRIARKSRNRAKNLSPAYQEATEIAARAREDAAVLFENIARQLCDRS